MSVRGPWISSRRCGWVRSCFDLPWGRTRAQIPDQAVCLISDIAKAVIARPVQRATLTHLWLVKVGSRQLPTCGGTCIKTTATQRMSDGAPEWRESRSWTLQKLPAEYP